MPNKAKDTVSVDMTNPETNQAAYRFITTAEVSEELRISIQSVHALIRKGVIPANLIGGSMRIPRCEFEAYLESTRVTPPTLPA